MWKLCGWVMNKVYLSRRNLETLLRKLDDPSSRKTIEKNDTVHPVYPTTEQTLVVAVEDEEYYTDRQPGVMKEDG